MKNLMTILYRRSNWDWSTWLKTLFKIFSRVNHDDIKLLAEAKVDVHAPFISEAPRYLRH